MVGCMVGSSLACRQALSLDADFVDLDGPLLTAPRPRAGLRYEGSRVYRLPPPALWG